MSTFEAIVLGIVQGLTEFLPVSSSGHLRIVPALAGWDDPGTAFTAVIQLGTMAAVVIYFWKDLWRIASAWGASLRDRDRRRDPDAKMGWYLIVATIPIGIFGLAFRGQIETGARDLRLIAGALIVIGLVLLAAEKVGTRTKAIGDLTTRDGIAVGLAQCLALVPGVSRSGSTIAAGLFLGYNRADAARFSFLLSVPAVVLSGLFQLPDVAAGDGPGLIPTLLATVVSFAVGYAAIAWLLRWLTSHSTAVFVVYRVGMGVLVLALLVAGSIDAQ
ncbi:undecaprenyl-diphosphate phosphatase [soil metagenome]